MCDGANIVIPGYNSYGLQTPYENFTLPLLPKHLGAMKAYLMLIRERREAFESLLSTSLKERVPMVVAETNAYLLGEFYLGSLIEGVQGHCGVGKEGMATPSLHETVTILRDWLAGSFGPALKSRRPWRRRPAILTIEQNFPGIAGEFLLPRWQKALLASIQREAGYTGKVHTCEAKFPDILYTLPRVFQYTAGVWKDACRKEKWERKLERQLICGMKALYGRKLVLGFDREGAPMTPMRHMSLKPMKNDSKARGEDVVVLDDSEFES